MLGTEGTEDHGFYEEIKTPGIIKQQGNNYEFTTSGFASKEI